MPTVSELTVRAASAAGAVANYCDHAEHNEEVDRRWVLTSAEVFRELAPVIAKMGGFDLRKTFIELGTPWGVNADDALADHRSLRDAQRVLIQHDLHVHPHVMGQARCNQLRHHALKAAILTGQIASNVMNEQVATSSLALGLRLATVMFEKLPEDAPVVWTA